MPIAASSALVGMLATDDLTMCAVSDRQKYRFKNSASSRDGRGVFAFLAKLANE